MTTKYNEETRKIRKLAREFIPKLLEKEPLAAKIIVEKTRTQKIHRCGPTKRLFNSTVEALFIGSFRKIINRDRQRQKTLR